MLACIQRRQNLSYQHLVCAPKVLDVVPPTLPQNNSRKHEPASMTSSRYPSAAELDAFAQRTARSPLSIKIFPSNVRVPQHKQVSRTVNGLDTTGQRYSPYLHPYQGLLAVSKASVLVRGVVKSSEGKRTKHSPAQAALVSYDPLGGAGTARHAHKAYRSGPYKPDDGGPCPAAPFHAVPAAAVLPTAGGPTLPLAPQAGPGHVHTLLRHMAQQRGGGAQASPSLQAVAAVACSDSGFALEAGPQSSLAYSGAVLPTQSADRAKAGYLDTVDYGMWQQHYQQGALRMYSSARGSGRGGDAVSRSPETCLPLACSTQLSYRPHPLSGPGAGGGLERVSSSPLTCASVHGELSLGQYFAPPWNSVLVTPDSDCYTSQELRPSSSIGLSLPQPRPSLHPNLQPRPSLHPNPQPHLLHPHPHPQAYSSDPSLAPCCGLPSTSLCHASALSSSLQSLECLISEIHPPCIKERMLGRGYDALGMPRLLDYHQHHQNQNHQNQQQQQHSRHIQLPVFR